MQGRSTSERIFGTIDATILASIHAHRIRPGSRLGEAELASLFGVSRTLVREAMMRLQARRIVEVRPRRGWFVVEPSAHEAREVFQARRIIEAGSMRSLSLPIPPEDLAAIRLHLDQERRAIEVGNRPALICLLGDFHIRLAELPSNPVIVDILRDLTARTILICMLYQSEEHAEESHRGHCLILEAIEAGDGERAAVLAMRHLDEVEAGLDLDLRKDPLRDLRRSLDLLVEPTPSSRPILPYARRAGPQDIRPDLPSSQTRDLL